MEAARMPCTGASSGKNLICCPKLDTRITCRVNYLRRCVRLAVVSASAPAPHRGIRADFDLTNGSRHTFNFNLMKDGRRPGLQGGDHTYGFNY